MTAGEGALIKGTCSWGSSRARQSTAPPDCTGCDPIFPAPWWQAGRTLGRPQAPGIHT